MAIGLFTGIGGVIAISTAISAFCDHDVSRQKKARADAASKDNTEATPPRTPPVGYQAARGGRDLVGRQRARIEATAAASIPVPQQGMEPQTRSDISPHEVFTAWAHEFIQVTGNQHDIIPSVSIFKSYLGCCRSNSLPELDPQEFLQSLDQFSGPMGYLLVEAPGGAGAWEMLNAQLKG
jgi:hypothetical protein